MTGNTTESGPIAAHQVVSVLRLVALALVVVGFAGWALEDAAAFDLESPYTIAFGVGVACAFASIYLGIFLADGGDE
ncbi:hypothetical protein [Natronobacterium texcoconense]|uniref:Uncharacterized protein n=1 Tax=Natronobacterium texcoconense TaxID=1095778 RepID=A0A1H1I0W0_NATTX|nr:hypothetical protein [Natronobacterium texcoconense]SDR31334.1 hypothetical protein SAMN04489842_3217 [Natronobacterium texcoconense]